MSRARQGGAYRPLISFDADLFVAHLLRLSAEDRRSRFRQFMSDERIAEHARAALEGDKHVIGWFHEGVLRGSAEIVLSDDRLTAEAAFEVEAEWRGLGVCGELVERALLWARNRGARTLDIYTERANRPMLRAAKRRGAAFTFDLSEAEGAISAATPDLFSFMREIEEAERGWFGWWMQNALRGMSGSPLWGAPLAALTEGARRRSRKSMH